MSYSRIRRKKLNNLELKKIANEVRKGIITGVHAAKAGHPGGSLSSADLMTFLYFEEMNVDPKNPDDKNRDRFVLSKGHCAPGLYSVMAQKGYFPVEELTTLRKLGSRLQGHPSMQYLPGIDMSSGSLGQGISAACGMAAAGKIDKADFRVYTLLGDGELEEGQVWEAAMFAGAKELDNLCVIVDNNNLQIDGNIDDVNSPKPIDKKFEAFRFHVIECNGHDFDEIRAAFKEARETKGQPTCIIMHTVKGKGVSFMENKASWHGTAPNDEQYAAAMEELGKIDEELNKEGGVQ
jgi:Transketolase, N-terminal subunit